MGKYVINEIYESDLVNIEQLINREILYQSSKTSPYSNILIGTE